jgi:hypothetical protein
MYLNARGRTRATGMCTHHEAGRLDEGPSIVGSTSMRAMAGERMMPSGRLED